MSDNRVGALVVCKDGICFPNEAGTRYQVPFNQLSVQVSLAKGDVGVLIIEQGSGLNFCTMSYRHIFMLNKTLSKKNIMMWPVQSKTVADEEKLLRGKPLLEAYVVDINMEACPTQISNFLAAYKNNKIVKDIYAYEECGDSAGTGREYSSVMRIEVKVSADLIVVDLDFDKSVTMSLKDITLYTAASDPAVGVIIFKHDGNVYKLDTKGRSLALAVYGYLSAYAIKSEESIVLDDSVAKWDNALIGFNGLL